VVVRLSAGESAEARSEIFERAARELGGSPDDCLFVDDRLRNCEAARAAGMNAIHFRGDVTALRASSREFRFS